MQRSNPNNDPLYDHDINTEKLDDTSDEITNDDTLDDKTRRVIWFEDPYHYLIFKRNDDTMFHASDLTVDSALERLDKSFRGDETTEQATILPKFCNIL